MAESKTPPSTPPETPAGQRGRVEAAFGLPPGMAGGDRAAIKAAITHRAAGHTEASRATANIQAGEVIDTPIGPMKRLRGGGAKVPIYAPLHPE